jgi:putative endonuclease
MRPRRTRLGRGGLYMYYVYIIYSQKIKKLYIGYSVNLKERMIRHNSGRSKFTSKGMPWMLVHYQGFLEKEDARDEELFLKTGRGRERIKYLLNSFFKKNK